MNFLRISGENRERCGRAAAVGQLGPRSRRDVKDFDICPPSASSLPDFWSLWTRRRLSCHRMSPLTNFSAVNCSIFQTFRQFNGRRPSETALRRPATPHGLGARERRNSLSKTLFSSLFHLICLISYEKCYFCLV